MIPVTNGVGVLYGVFKSPKLKLMIVSKLFKALIRRTFIFAFFLLFLSIGIGTVGYHYFCNFDWVESFFNASMIATGMGPADDPPEAMGKIFSAIYSLFGAFTFLTVFGVIFTPLFHSLMKKYQILDKENCE